MPSTASHFLSLHVPGRPLLLPNPWDVGSAKVLAALGFEALATTSSGSAMALGKLDGEMGLESALTGAGEIVRAVSVPVSIDFENGFAEADDGLADNIARVRELGAAGCSIEDFGGEIYSLARAAERVRVAAEAAHRGKEPIVLTARSENYLHGRPDLRDTITRLQAFQEAGADVLYAPGLTDLGEIGSVVQSVGLPLNVLAVPGTPSVAELADVGVARVSVGGAFAFTALDAMVEAARELREVGTFGYLTRSAAASAMARETFGGQSR